MLRGSEGRRGLECRFPSSQSQHSAVVALPALIGLMFKAGQALLFTSQAAQQQGMHIEQSVCCNQFWAPQSEKNGDNFLQ